MTQPYQVFTGRALEIVADDKIRRAIEEGQFDHLPGLGQPHPIFDEPYDPHWWIRRKLERESLPPSPDLLEG